MKDALPQELSDAIRAAYARLNVPGQFFNDTTITTHEILTELLLNIEPRIPEMDCCITPSSFDPDDADLRGFPRSPTWRWISCERTLRSANVRAVMTRLPAYWQMNLPIHSACRAVGIPIFTNEPENIPVGAMALKLGGIDTVITESRTVAAFADHLIEHALPYPKLSVLLHRVEEVPDVPSAVRETWGVVSQEILAFPGVPVLEQCALLAEKKVPLFHLSDAYFWEISDTSSLITSIGEDPFPLFRYALACTLRRTGECGCGRAVFEHNV